MAFLSDGESDQEVLKEAVAISRFPCTKVLIQLANTRKAADIFEGFQTKIAIEDPVSFEHFQQVWQVRNDRMITNLPHLLLDMLKTVHILSVTEVHVLIFQHGIHPCTICQFQHLIQTSIGEMKIVQLAMS